MVRDRKPPRSRARLLAVSVATLTIGGTALAELPGSTAGKPMGHDVSSYQRNVDWQGAKKKGARFVYVKATESHTYRNPYFGRQYEGARNAGLLRGAYHFALPNRSSGTAQAAHFVGNGGGWRADDWTLPPALDVEHNPYDKKKKCYGLSKTEMVGWIKAFSNEVNRRTGRRPVIYTTTGWWNDCTGGSRAFGANHPLWLARYNASAGALPAGWTYWTFWQHDDSGTFPGDQNLFNGSMTGLRKFANAEG
ncbi:lysozyme [Streptomyces cavernae]|uniref:lysozyme n=1 Tax=Streptomyces cavernae TaxID=2259034 RepID=UPI000FEC115D|nr:lysozyme [Streptomyces cavernae]